MPVVVAGVDLAASAPNTAVARLDGTAVTALVVGADDAAVLDVVGDAVKVGIDCPLGWPEAFVDFVVAHRAGTVDATAETIEQRRPLAYRATDVYCQQRGMRPLSVSADRIGHAAMRGAGLLRALGETDRSGAGRVVETYPAGSLRTWGLTHAGYKRDGRLTALADEVASTVGLTFADDESQARYRSVDHAFDAVVAALTARAAALGHVEPVPTESRALAGVEGWIALPTCALADLADGGGMLTP